MASEGHQIEAAVPPKLSKDSPSGRINVIATEELLQEVEEWRASQRPIPNKSEAARMLIERGLRSADRSPNPHPKDREGERD